MKVGDLPCMTHRWRDSSERAHNPCVKAAYSEKGIELTKENPYLFGNVVENKTNQSKLFLLERLLCLAFAVVAPIASLAYCLWNEKAIGMSLWFACFAGNTLSSFLILQRLRSLEMAPHQRLILRIGYICITASIGYLLLSWLVGLYWASRFGTTG